MSSCVGATAAPRPGSWKRRHVRHVRQAQTSGGDCGIFGGYGSSGLFLGFGSIRAQNSAASPTFLSLTNTIAREPQFELRNCKQLYRIMQAEVDRLRAELKLADCGWEASNNVEYQLARTAMPR